MPLYSYRCGDCGSEFEALRALAQRDDAPRCPQCGENQSERVYKPFAVSVSAGGAKDACPSAGSCPHGGSCGCH